MPWLAESLEQVTERDAYAPGMELELDPAQPDAIVSAVAELLAPAASAPDPWWQAGLDESLESSDETRPEAPGG